MTVLCAPASQNGQVALEDGLCRLKEDLGCDSETWFGFSLTIFFMEGEGFHRFFAEFGRIFF